MKMPFFNGLVVLLASGAIVIGDAMLARPAYAAGPSVAYAHVRGDGTLAHLILPIRRTLLQ
jgi:hypothetical protein